MHERGRERERSSASVKVIWSGLVGQSTERERERDGESMALMKWKTKSNQDARVVSDSPQLSVQSLKLWKNENGQDGQDTTDTLGHH